MNAESRPWGSVPSPPRSRQLCPLPWAFARATSSPTRPCVTQVTPTSFILRGAVWDKPPHPQGPSVIALQTPGWVALWGAVSDATGWRAASLVPRTRCLSVMTTDAPTCSQTSPGGRITSGREAVTVAAGSMPASAAEPGGSHLPRGATAPRARLGGAVLETQPCPCLLPSVSLPKLQRPNVAASGEGERLNEVARAGPRPDGPGVLVRERERPPRPLAGGRPQGAARRSPSARHQEERPHQTPNRRAPRAWTPGLQNRRKSTSVVQKCLGRWRLATRPRSALPGQPRPDKGHFHVDQDSLH